jgi:Ca2+/Na+ antiporter
MVIGSTIYNCTVVCGSWVLFSSWYCERNNLVKTTAVRLRKLSIIQQLILRTK